MFYWDSQDMLADQTHATERALATHKARLAALLVLAAACFALALLPRLAGAGLLCLATGLLSGRLLGRRAALAVTGSAALAVLAARFLQGQPLTIPLVVG
jgi:hypothetical protein